MATRATLLPNAAEFPDANFPQLGSIHTNVRRAVLSFDAATDESAYWTMIAPQGLTGTITAVISYCAASATTGSFRWEVLVEAITDGDSTDLDSAQSEDATNSGGATVPGTAGFIDQISITLTNADSMAAADLVRIRLRRDADGTTGTDDASGDAHVLAVEIRDAA
jgi:hypothetical protein